MGVYSSDVSLAHACYKEDRHKGERVSRIVKR